MIVDVVLILIIAAYAILAGAALYGAGTSVANAVRRRRLTLAVEDQTADEQPIIVADYGQMAALPEALYEDLFDHLDRRRRWPAAPNDTWQPARPDDTPGVLVPGEGDIEPQPTLREETLPATAEAVLAARPYVMGGWIQVGASRVHRGCSEARRDGRRICGYCSPFLVGSASPAVPS